VVALVTGTGSPAFRWFDERLPESVVALVAAALLFILPVNWSQRRFTLDWNQAAHIDWGTILLFGGGLSLGDLMFKTGLADVLGRGLVTSLSLNTLWGLTAVATALGIVVSELTSNTASANMVIPVMIAMAKALNVNPVPPAIAACLGASYGFMLPISTPPNAIVYGSGLVPITKMLRAGILFDLLGFFLIWLGLRLLLPLLGMS
jgi:sodium-dependent dicarboxylate transporter 2/3/5